MLRWCGLLIHDLRIQGRKFLRDRRVFPFSPIITLQLPPKRTAEDDRLNVVILARAFVEDITGYSAWCGNLS